MALVILLPEGDDFLLPVLFQKLNLREPAVLVGCYLGLLAKRNIFVCGQGVNQDQKKCDQHATKKSHVLELVSFEQRRAKGNGQRGS